MYVEGFVFAVPNRNKQQFIDYAETLDRMLIEHGAARVVECWGDDIETGKLTDFRMAFNVKEDETVLFSWIEWPDKETRVATLKQMEEVMKTNEHLRPEENSNLFDESRMIYGGFNPVIELHGK